MLKTSAVIGGQIVQIDTIEYEGQFWLVPEWLLSPDGTEMRPARIIRLLSIPHEGDPRQKDPPQFVIPGPLPEHVLQGLPPLYARPKYEVVEAPDIWFQTPAASP
jgi:hypothetical protein